MLQKWKRPFANASMRGLQSLNLLSLNRLARSQHARERHRAKEFSMAFEKSEEKDIHHGR
jgi:hypothetical protein